jgi:hypothetical protein
MIEITEIIATSKDFAKHQQSVNFQETTSVLIKFTIFALIIR